MQENYDTDSFNIFMIAITTIYLIFDVIYLIWSYRSVQRDKRERDEYLAKHRDGKIDLEMQNKKIGFSTMYYVNLVLFVLGIFLLMYLYDHTESQEAEVFDPYEILGISIGASDREIKRSYHRMALKYHPDKSPNDAEKFQQVERAYLALTDEIAKYNWETYGNPDGPVNVSHGIGLPEWISEGKGQVFFLIFYFAIFIVAIPFVVKYFKKRSDSKTQESIKEHVCQDTVGIYYSFMSSNLLISSLPEYFSCAKEFDHTMDHDEERDILLRKYYLQMNKSTDSKGNYIVPRMKKPKIPLELLDTNEEHSSNLRVAILIYAYLAGLEIDDRLKPILNGILSKCDIFFDGLLTAALFPLKGNHFVDKDRVVTVIRFIQLMYQGRFYKDSSLLQLPHFNESIIKSVKNKSTESDLKNYIKMNPEKRPGLKRFTPEQIVDVNKAIANIPLLDIQAHLEVEGEKEIVQGDLMTLVIKITRTNIPLPEETSEVEETPEEHETESIPHYEGEIDLNNATSLGNDPEESDDIYAYVKNMKEEDITCLPVYSKNYPFVLREKFYILVCNALDTEVVAFVSPDQQFIPAFNSTEDQHRTFENRSIHIPAFKEGPLAFTVHIFSANYIGMDYTLPVQCTVLSRDSIEEEQELIRKRDEEELRKEGKGLLESMINQEEENDDDWNSDDESPNEDKESTLNEKKQKSAEEIALNDPNLSRKDRKRLELKLRRKQKKNAASTKSEEGEEEKKDL